MPAGTRQPLAVARTAGSGRLGRRLLLVCAALLVAGGDSRLAAEERPQRPGERIDAALAPPSGRAGKLLVAAGLGSLVALAVPLWLSRRGPRRRLRRLAGQARRLAAGQLDRPVPIDGHDELAELATLLEAYRCSLLSHAHRDRLVRERGRALAALQRDLDLFARIAAQDLEAPLRAVDSLAGFLREDLGAELGGDSLRHLELLQVRVRRARQRLDALLEYARAGRGRLPVEAVDLRDLIEHCVDLACPPGAQALLNGSFGRVSTRRAALEQIVCNLLDNAFRHNDVEHGLVGVDCDLDGSEVHIVVSDCGPGILPEAQERIFGLFQTLEPQEADASRGTGLAVVKKLIDGHGGTIEIDSDPARRRGTAFIVRWPVDAVLSVVPDPADQVVAAIAGVA